MADNHVLQLTGAELDETLKKVSQLSEDIGDIDAALDSIIAMQNAYINGGETA